MNSNGHLRGAIQCAVRGIQRLYGLTHQIEKKVVFNSFNGLQYSDSPRAISETMHMLYPDYKIVWLLDHSINDLGLIPNYVNIIYRHAQRFAFCKEISTCVAYVASNQLSASLYHRKNQLFIQTWHGDRTFKKILYDARNGKKGEPIADEWLTNLCIAGSDFGERIYRTAFHYHGEVLKAGMPRNDRLVCPDNSRIESIRRKLGIPDGTQVLIYAPTFRDNKREHQAVNVDLGQVMSILEEEGKRWVCLIRAHAAANGLDFDCDGQRFIDASEYPDMADLLMIGDMLITDYSSCAGDFIITGKPVLLACFDQEEYTTNCRAFYTPIEKTGFIVAHNQNELTQLIRTKTTADYAESSRLVCEHYGINETGHAAESVCQKIDEFYRAHH